VPSVAVGALAWLAAGPLVHRGDRLGDVGGLLVGLVAGGAALAGCFALLRVRADITVRPPFEGAGVPA
jgi:hypothetical protein